MLRAAVTGHAAEAQRARPQGLAPAGRPPLLQHYAQQAVGVRQPWRQPRAPATNRGSESKQPTALRLQPCHGRSLCDAGPDALSESLHGLAQSLHVLPHLRQSLSTGRVMPAIRTKLAHDAVAQRLVNHSRHDLQVDHHRLLHVLNLLQSRLRPGPQVVHRLQPLSLAAPLLGEAAERPSKLLEALLKAFLPQGQRTQPVLIDALLGHRPTILAAFLAHAATARTEWAVVGPWQSRHGPHPRKVHRVLGLVHRGRTRRSPGRPSTPTGGAAQGFCRP
mmetsp:Transcript_47385/g.141423  ORF Transcript_47385/g.141423 Transcript_47385/m.141423 type:complete len:277 (+) Transcript_47385:959-1789(+)